MQPVAQFISNHRLDHPQPISQSHPKQVVPELSLEIDSLVAKATGVDVDSRFKSADDDGADLVSGVVPAPAGRRHRAGDQLQPCRMARACARAGAVAVGRSTGRSTSP